MPVLVISGSRETQDRVGSSLAALRVPHTFCETLRSAGTMMDSHAWSVVIAEAELPDGNWLDVLERLPVPGPALIITSRLADEALWLEALNRGAWDVLPQPFDSAEISRVVLLARARAAGSCTYSGRASPWAA